MKTSTCCSCASRPEFTSAVLATVIVTCRDVLKRPAARRFPGYAYRVIVRCVVVACLAVASLPASAVAQSKIGSVRFELDHGKHTPSATKQREHFRRTLKCKVVPIRGTQRALVRRAIAHANRVVNGPAFRALIIEHAKWVASTDTARTILHNLTYRQLTVHVSAFRRDKQHPCKTHFADGHTNAFVPDVRLGKLSKARLLFLSERYLQEQYLAPRPRRGVRKLARTLVHEALHVMGYSHAGQVPFSGRYNRTVPVYLGCLVMNLRGPHIKWVRNNCRRATGLRKTRSPYRWLCYSNLSLRQHLRKRVRIAMPPDAKTNAARSHPAILLQVHEDHTVTVRWRNGGQIKRVNKCRLIM